MSPPMRSSTTQRSPTSSTAGRAARPSARQDTGKADRFGNDLLAILGRHERPATAAPPAPPPRAKAPPVDHGDLDLGLVEALRAWRLEHTDGKPAYTVFSNATMEELAATRPTTTDELLAVSGIGPAKVERFGAELLAFLADRD